MGNGTIMNSYFKSTNLKSVMKQSLILSWSAIPILKSKGMNNAPVFKDWSLKFGYLWLTKCDMLSMYNKIKKQEIRTFFTKYSNLWAGFMEEYLIINSDTWKAFYRICHKYVIIKST